MSVPTVALDLFAVAAPGLEGLLRQELASLGVEGTATEGGVAWTGSAAQMRHVNLHARLASRVLVRLGTFRARGFIELERHATRLPWAGFLGGGPVELRVTARKSKLYHEGAIAERLYRILGVEPPEPTGSAGDEEADGEGAQLFVVRAVRDVFTISADTSGAALHRRGYRLEVARAPLRETLAAALLAAGGFGDEPFLDPFCGAGTLPVEAALAARRIAPGLASPDRRPRRYAFEGWPDHEPRARQLQVSSARARVLPRAPAPIFGSDRDAGAVDAAHQNARRAGVEEDVSWSVAPLSGAPRPDGVGLLATNPPYGQRVSAQRELRDLWAALGAYARNVLPGWRLAVLSPEPRLDGQVGVPLEAVAGTRNGGLPVRIMVGRTAP